MDQKTVKVHIWGGRHAAYYDGEDGQVWVYDPVDHHYTSCHSLTEGQVMYVRGRTRVRKLPA